MLLFAMAKQDPTQSAQIELAPPARRAETLQLLRIPAPRTQRLLASQDHGQLDMQGLFLARRGQTLVGAAWGQITAGRSAFCWPAHLVPGEPEETAFQLQAAVDDYLDREHVVVIQAVLSVRAVTDAMRLVRAGYYHLADLNYLVCHLDDFPHERPATDLDFEPFSPGDPIRLRKLVARTYLESLDCAGLDHSRPLADVLEGYRETGRYRPEWWLAVRHDGHDVGCVLMADHPEHDQCELMYLGIVPEMRGRGWGIEATRHVQWLMRRVPRERMILAVDDTNWPAQGVYSSTGFDIWDRRCVYVRSTREVLSR
ncbi:MAG: GNAT family N-acetyltransferase [Pirellulaceae bacterium]